MELAVHSGGRIGILGAPGSGKTRLLRTLARLEPLPAGKVVWAAKDVSRRPRWLLGKLRTFVALVLQNPYTFIEPWAKVGKAFAISDDAMTLAQILGLAPLSRWYTIAMLSGVGRVRLALVRALLYHPAVLLVDDVFGSIAPDIWDTLLQELDQALHPEQALVIASQFASALSRVETVFVLWSGMVVEWGAREVIVSDPYYAYTRWLLRRLPGCPSPGLGPKEMEISFTSQAGTQEIVEVSPLHWVRMR
jgi:peptide/nickel transport system ATP-binding protein